MPPDQKVTNSKLFARLPVRFPSESQALLCEGPVTADPSRGQALAAISQISQGPV